MYLSKFDSIMLALERTYFIYLLLMVLWLIFWQTQHLLIGCLLIYLIIRVFFLSVYHFPIMIILLTCFSLSILHQEEHRQDLRALDLEGKPAQLDLILDPSDLKWSQNQVNGQTDIQFEGQELTIQWQYFTQDSEEKLARLKQTGSHLHLKGHFNRPAPARNFGLFDYQDYLAKQGLFWQFQVDELELIDQGTQLLPLPSQIRLHILNRIKLDYPGHWLSLHQKLMWNQDSEIYQAWRPGLAQLGILHFFAISGYHIYFIQSRLKSLFYRMGAPKILIDTCIFFFILFYAFLIGWPFGVQRILALMLFKLLKNSFNLPFTNLDGLSVITIVQLIFNPNILFNLSFVLSYFMTIILMFYQPVAKQKKRPFQVQFELSLLCLLFSWPLMVQMNFSFNPMQLITVLSVSFLFDRVIMPLMMGTSLILLFLPSLSPLLTSLDHLLASQIMLGSWDDLLNWSQIWTGTMELTSFLLLYLFAFLAMFFLTRSKKALATMMVLIYFIIFWLVPICRAYDRLTIIDVGQGDALCYQSAWNQETWLIDTGGRYLFDPEKKGKIDNQHANRVLIPALRALGVKQINGLILTHPDIDHVGNFIALGQTIPIDQVYISEYTFQSSFFDQVRQVQNTLKINKINILVPGSLLQVNDKIQIASLSLDLSLKDPDLSNDSSLLCLIQMKYASFLNLGDLSLARESALIKQLPQWSANIIKLGHHGSKTSSSELLLNHFRPELAFISAGANNHYGHPHIEVLERLQAQQISYLNTGYLGAIQYIDENGGWVRQVQHLEKKD